MSSSISFAKLDSVADGSMLLAEGISKRFGDMVALENISLSLAAGEVHGILGANGAGKSTLIRILSGAMRADGGSLRVCGRDVPLGSLVEARRAGLVVVHQELMLFPDRSVEENIFASAIPSRPFRLISRHSRRRKVEAAVERLGAVVDLNARVSDLSLSRRQTVEIARALCAGGTVLVLDESTSALSQTEAYGLFDAIRLITSREAAVIFVSHRLDEVFTIADTLTVLRDGCVAGRWKTAEVDIPTVTRAMVGSVAGERSRRRGGTTGRTVAIAVRGSAPGLSDLSLSLHSGEIVGLAGLEGSGVSTTLEMLGGIVPVRGQLEVKGRAVTFRHPSQAIAAGVVYMPPDRKKGGLWLDRDASYNIGIAMVARTGALRWLSRRLLDMAAGVRMAEVGVRANALHDPVVRLSGGNQQRILLARALEARPAVLLLSDFTRGVDVQAKAAIHALVRALAEAGMAVCITSSDLEELLEVADRIVCMSGGRIVANRSSEDFDKLSLLGVVAAANTTLGGS
jgi:ABC-type sugar transport system ATPase subunit